MAASIVAGSQEQVESAFGHTEQVEYENLVAGETVTYTIPSTAPQLTALSVHAETVTDTTSRDPIFVKRLKASDTSTTLAFRFDTVTGGSLTGGIVRLLVHWRESASGGIS